MNALLQFQELAKEKNIPEKELDIIMVGFTSSATAQAMEVCGITKENLSSFDLSFLDDQEQVKALILEEGPEAFNKKVDAALSKSNVSFLEVYNRALDKLLSDFIVKVKDM